MADFGTVVLLALFFSHASAGFGIQIFLISGLVLLAVVVVQAVRRAEHSSRLQIVQRQLESTSSEIRVRWALLLLVGFAALAERLGIEVILGAFLAGTTLGLVDRESDATHQIFRQKLNAIGYGVFIPIFMVSSGMRFDIGSLVTNSNSLILIPLLLGTPLLVRGLPALLYRSLIGWRGALAAGFLQSTSLSFIVAAVQIGTELNLINYVVWGCFGRSGVAICAALSARRIGAVATSLRTEGWADWKGSR